MNGFFLYHAVFKSLGTPAWKFRLGHPTYVIVQITKFKIWLFAKLGIE